MKLQMQSLRPKSLSVFWGCYCTFPVFLIRNHNFLVVSRQYHTCWWHFQFFVSTHKQNNRFHITDVGDIPVFWSPTCVILNGDPTTNNWNAISKTMVDSHYIDDSTMWFFQWEPMEHKIPITLKVKLWFPKMVNDVVIKFPSFNTQVNIIPTNFHNSQKCWCFFIIPKKIIKHPIDVIHNPQKSQ